MPPCLIHDYNPEQQDSVEGLCLLTHCMSHYTMLLGELSAVHTTPQVCVWSLCLMRLLPLLIFNLYAFSVINHNHEFNHLLTSVSPSTKSLNPRVVLETRMQFLLVAYLEVRGNLKGVVKGHEKKSQ